MLRTSNSVNPDVSFAYNFLNSSNRYWIKNQFSAHIRWKKFAERSKTIGEGYKFTCVADIQEFYPNISLTTLEDDLAELGIQGRLVKEVTTLLDTWSKISPGLPQGYTPSHWLGETYLGPIDTSLIENQIPHIRYLDDFHIFADSEAAIDESLQFLKTLCGMRGLSINSKKVSKFESASPPKTVQNLNYGNLGSRVIPEKCSPGTAERIKSGGKVEKHELRQFLRASFRTSPSQRGAQSSHVLEHYPWIYGVLCFELAISGDPKLPIVQILEAPGVGLYPKYRVLLAAIRHGIHLPDYCLKRLYGQEWYIDEAIAFYHLWMDGKTEENPARRPGTAERKVRGLKLANPFQNL